VSVFDRFPPVLHGCCAALALLLGMPAAVHAADFVPASPEEGRVPVSAVLDRPAFVDWRDGTATVNCQVLVSRRGRAKGLKCGLASGFTDDDRAEKLLPATYAALRRAKFRPAEVDGETVDVVMSVRVVVRCIGDRCETSSYPNLGLYALELGNQYYAPQEVLRDGGTWYERMLDAEACEGDREPAPACVDEGAFRLVLYLDIDPDGEPVQVRYRDNPLNGDADAVMAAAEAEFLPGLVDGEPREMTVLTSSLHYDNNRDIPKSICVEFDDIRSRLPERRCYNPQQYARVTPSLQILSWLPMTGN
jgi:hypothetical protein